MRVLMVFIILCSFLSLGVVSALPNLEIVCPDPCPISTEMLQEKNLGVQQGYSELRMLIGIDPFSGYDFIYYLVSGDNLYCKSQKELGRKYGFVAGYSTISGSKGIICDYSYYNTGNIIPFKIESLSRIEGQALAVHEMSHFFFMKHTSISYPIQESFAGAQSSYVTGIWDGSGIEASDFLKPETPCLEGISSHVGLVPLLCRYYGLGWDQFDDIYSALANYETISGRPADDKVLKQVLDGILDTDTSQAFYDSGNLM